MALKAKLTTRSGTSLSAAYIRLADPQVNWSDNTLRMTLQTFASTTARENNLAEVDVEWTQNGNKVLGNVRTQFERTETFNDIVSRLYNEAKTKFTELQEATDV
jgi:hypothetical protein